MRIMLFNTMAAILLVVFLVGGFLVITVLLDLLFRAWVKKARFAHNLVNYLRNRSDYEVYMAQKEDAPHE